jgi:uncharacterized membrane protein YhiD involved in acid resistance
MMSSPKPGSVWKEKGRAPGWTTGAPVYVAGVWRDVGVHLCNLETGHIDAPGHFMGLRPFLETYVQVYDIDPRKQLRLKRDQVKREMETQLARYDEAIRLVEGRPQEES